MLDATRKSRIRAALERGCTGALLEDMSSLRGFERDFGGMLRRAPAFVLRPGSTGDVVHALRVAREHELPVTTRGAGHCQSGQSLGDGLVIDLRSLGRVIAVDDERGLVEMEAGATWRHVTDVAFARGLLPVALTHALDTTVGGTLSVAGVGAESFRLGAQVDHVLCLDVATIDGEVVRTSLDERRELFDSVCAGLGQCGVMLRARYPLHRTASLVTTSPFVFRSGAALLDAVARLSEPSGPARYLSAVLATDPLRSERGALLLYVGRDHEPGACLVPLPDLDAELALPSRTSPIWSESGRPAHPFFRVFDEVALSAGLNPWLEYLLPTSTAETALDHLLERAPELLACGQAGVIFVRRPDGARAPLFVTPPGALSVGVGIFASVPEARQADALQLIQSESTWLERLAGKRYLSGYFADTSSATWAEHYGGAWDTFQAAKKRSDSQGLLNPGFLHFDRKES